MSFFFFFLDYQPSRAALVTNMVQAKVVQDHSIPVIPLQLVGDMPGDIIVHLGEVLYSSAFALTPDTLIQATYRHEKATRPIRAIKHARKQLQPCIIAIHDQLSGTSGAHLGQPGILVGQTGRLICLVQVEDDIQERRDRPRGDGLQPRHGDCG